MSKTKNYNEEFKKQIVALRKNGKTIATLSAEYEIAKSTINKWVKDYSTTGSFLAKDNRSEEEKELIRLRKENRQLLMKNEVIKIFNNNRKVYGARKIKESLKNTKISRRKIRKIMMKHNLISKYTKRIYKKRNSKVNDDCITNEVARGFNNREHLEVVVSDLTCKCKGQVALYMHNHRLAQQRNNRLFSR